MKAWRAFKKNSICILSGSGFYLSAALSVILYLTAGIADGREGESFSAIQLMMDYQNCVKEMTDPSMAGGGWLISRMRMAEYLSMFLPIIASFPAVPLYIDERRSGFQRFGIVRCSRVSYTLAQILAAGLYGGLAVMLGFCVSTALVLAGCPAPESAADFNAYSMALSAGSGMQFLAACMGESGICIGFAMDVFLYACFFALPGAVMTCFLDNAYLDICMPMVLVYLYDVFLKKAAAGAMVSGNVQISRRLSLMLSTSLGQSFSMWTAPKMIFMISGLAAACGLGVWKQRRKTDAGT